MFARRARAVPADGAGSLQTRNSRPVNGMHRFAKIATPRRFPRRANPFLPGTSERHLTHGTKLVHSRAAQPKTHQHHRQPAHDGEQYQPEQHFGSQRMPADIFEETVQHAHEPRIDPLAQQIPLAGRPHRGEFAALQNLIERGASVGGAEAAMRGISLQLKSNRVRPGLRLSEARFSRGCIAFVALDQLAQWLAGKFVVRFRGVNLPRRRQCLLYCLYFFRVPVAFFDRALQAAHFGREAGGVINTGSRGGCNGLHALCAECRCWPGQDQQREKNKRGENCGAAELCEHRGPFADGRHGIILKRTSWANCSSAEPCCLSDSSSAECRMLPCAHAGRNKVWRSRSSGSASPARWRQTIPPASVATTKSFARDPSAPPQP